jgi:hypothetical protein
MGNCADVVLANHRDLRDGALVVLSDERGGHSSRARERASAQWGKEGVGGIILTKTGKIPSRYNLFDMLHLYRWAVSRRKADACQVAGRFRYNALSCVHLGDSILAPFPLVSHS